MSPAEKESEEIQEFIFEEEYVSPLKSCIEFLEEHKKEYQKGDAPYTLGPDDTPFQITDQRIFKIPQCEEVRRIGFVDGGSAPILASADFCVNLNRVAGAVFDSYTYEEFAHMPELIEFYSATVLHPKNDGSLRYITKIFPREKEHVQYLPQKDIIISIKDPSIITGRGFLPKIEKFGSIARRFAEWTDGQELINRELHEGDIFVRDGSLQTSYTGETLLATFLYKKALEKNVCVTGLSKTCRLFTNNGDCLISIIDSIASNKFPNNEWYYHPIYKITKADNKADLYFIKLHRASLYPFRFDIYIEQSEKMTQDERENVISNLALNSQDLSFPGYPHGLIKVDQLSRVSFRELDAHKIMLLSEFTQDNYEKYIQP